MTKKDTIIHVATRLFAYHGYDNTSSAEIAKASEVAEGTIFYHFKTKEDIFLAVLEQVRKDLIHEFEEYFRQHTFKDSLEAIEGLISFYLFLAASKEESFLLIHRFYPYLLARQNPACRAHLEAIYGSVVDYFERTIAAGQAEGLMIEAPVRKTALLIFTLVDGLARFRTFSLYDAGALHNDLLRVCHRVLTEVDKEKIC